MCLDGGLSALDCPGLGVFQGVPLVLAEPFGIETQSTRINQPGVFGEDEGVRKNCTTHLFLAQIDGLGSGNLHKSRLHFPDGWEPGVALVGSIAGTAMATLAMLLVPNSRPGVHRVIQINDVWLCTV